MPILERDTLFVALTRPQMFAGVTYSWFIANAVIATELFLLFRSPWTLILALAGHVIGATLSLRDSNFFDIWLVRSARCPRVRNYRVWRCNSYPA